MENIPHGTWNGYSNHKCRCELCRKAAREYQQQRRDEKRAEDLEGYRAKRAEEARRWREQNPDRVKDYDKISKRRALEKGAAQPENVPHGSRSGYQTFGCRCELCKRAQWEYEQERKGKDPEKFKEQNREKARRYRERNRERLKEQSRLNYYRAQERDPERVTTNQKRASEAYRLRSKGTDAKTEALLLGQQNGVCAICGQQDTRKLCIDHCHATKRIRGLLCRRCNLGLGCFGDDVSALKKAIAYLEKD